VDQLSLGKPRHGFLGIAIRLWICGTRFWARSWEVQDILANSMKTSVGYFMHLDKEIGHGTTLFALTADHGVVPIPEDMQKTRAPTPAFLHAGAAGTKLKKPSKPSNIQSPRLPASPAATFISSPGVL